MLHSSEFQILVVLATALSLVSIIFARIGVPTVVALLATGIFVGPSGLKWVESIPEAESISEIGMVLLMFILGLELSIEQLRSSLKALFFLGAPQVFFTALFFALFAYVGLTGALNSSLILGTCLAFSSTAIVTKALADRREMETPHGRASILILIFQDLAALPVLTLIPYLSTKPQLETQSWSIFPLILFFIVFLGLGRKLVPRIYLELVRTQSREVFFFGTGSLICISAYFATKSGLSPSIGAFLLGALIAGSPFNRQAQSEFIPFRDIFLGFFFASVGLMVDLSVILTEWRWILMIFPVVLIMKGMILYAVARVNRYSHGVSLSTALGLFQVGEFALMVASLARAHDLIDPVQFQIFLAISVCSLVLTPFAMDLALRFSGHPGVPGARPSHGIVQDHESPLKPRTAVVIGLGHAGQDTLNELTSRGIPCFGVDINHQNVSTVKKLGFQAFYGDCTRADVLESLGLHDAFLIVVTVSGRSIVPQIVASALKVNPKLKTVVRVHYLAERSQFDESFRQHVVVSEIETALAIVKKCLEHYDAVETV